MGVEGSSGTPTFKQIIMQKQRENKYEGVRISRLDNNKQNDRRNKEKIQGETDKPDSTTEGKGTVGESLIGTKDKITSIIKSSENEERKAEEDREQTDNGQGKTEKEGETSTRPNIYSASNGVCKPKKTNNLRVVITDPKIQAYREHMAEHAVISKFMGIWPSERTLCHWIRQHWKPRGDVKLHLGAKGFFTVVFSNLEDKDRIFEGGPYFFASAGLYMRPWNQTSPQKKNLSPKSQSGYVCSLSQ